MTDKNLDSVDKENKDISKSTGEAESQTAPATINHSEPEPEYWDYMGIDSTSPLNIDIVSVDDPDQESVNEWIGKIKKPKKGQNVF